MAKPSYEELEKRVNELDGKLKKKEKVELLTPLPALRAILLKSSLTQTVTKKR